MKNLYENDDELRKEFQDAFSSIQASEELKNRTLTQMQTGEEPGEKSISIQKKKFRYVSIPAAALLCALILVSLLRGTMGVSYLTVMEEGVYYDSVELKDGEILFVANQVAVSITPNAGEIMIGQDDGEENASSEMIEERETDAGGCLTYQRTGRVSLPEINEKSWSHIGKQKIYVTVLKTEEIRYQAIFEKDGQAYEVLGVNVSQKEFIDYLYLKIKK